MFLLNFLPIIFYSISGIFDAVMDTLVNHFPISVFKNLNSQFWNPLNSWKNKYVNGDVNQGHVKIKILFFEMDSPDSFSDAWHIAKFLREGFIILAILSAVMFVRVYPPIHYPLFIFAMLISLASIRNYFFILFYSKLLIKL
jgi:hypothetical protein